MAKRQVPLSQGKLQRAVTKDANEQDVAPSRAMRWVSAAAFFESLNRAKAEHRIDGYAIKGGFAVELRHYAAARTSEDIDLILVGKRQAIELLRNILPTVWDAFHFEIKNEDPREHVVRVEVRVRFNGNSWGTLKVDVIDGTIADIERVKNVAIERFGLSTTTDVACLSRPHQLAEWIHGTTRPETEGQRKNRARNLVDIYLFNTLAPSDDDVVRTACIATFAREKAHAWPPNPSFPEAWNANIAEVIDDVGLATTPDDLVAHVTAYIERLTA